LFAKPEPAVILASQGDDEKIILKRILKKLAVREWTGVSWLWI
jgi:hypothetical protein